MDDKIKYIICIIASVIVNFLGGWDMWLAALITVIFLDVITGIMKSILMHSNKSESGGLNSVSMFHGGVKKVFILLMVALGSVLSNEYICFCMRYIKRLWLISTISDCRYIVMKKAKASKTAT